MDITGNLNMDRLIRFAARIFQQVQYDQSGSLSHAMLLTNELGKELEISPGKALDYILKSIDISEHERIERIREKHR